MWLEEAKEKLDAKSGKAMARETLISPRHWGVQERGRTTGRKWKGEEKFWRH